MQVAKRRGDLERAFTDYVGGVALPAARAHEDGAPLCRRRLRARGAEHGRKRGCDRAHSTRARCQNPHFSRPFRSTCGLRQAHRALPCWGNSRAKWRRRQAVRPDRARSGGCDRRGYRRAAGRAAPAVGSLRARPDRVRASRAGEGADPRRPATCRRGPEAPACSPRRREPCARLQSARSDRAAPWSGDGRSTLATTARIDQ